MYDALYEQSIQALQHGLHQGEITSVNLVETALKRITAYDQSGPALNAMVHINEQAWLTAEHLDTERAQGRVRGPLHGLPIVIKDNFLTQGMPTTAGCKALTGLPTDRDAWQVQQLRHAGAILIGKSTLHELAAGITNASSVSGHTRNPYGLDHVPGGSSGGTAVAVAASYAVAGLGSDTSGSIRVPASCQNLYGLRPTWGLSSRSGIVPLCPSHDMGAPLARWVHDLAIMLDATVGPDPADPATWQVAHCIPDSFTQGLKSDALRGVRIGVLSSLFGDGDHEYPVSHTVHQALLQMQALGATLVTLDTPGLDTLAQAGNLTAYEFKFALADFLSKAGTPIKSLTELIAVNMHHKEVDSVLRLRDQTTHPDSPERYYAIEQRIAVRRVITHLIQQHNLQVLAYPTLRCAPVRIGERQPGENCALSPVLGWPAISIPAGFTDSGLPIGLDLLAPAYQEQALLNYALTWEQADVRRRAPASTPALQK